MIGGCVNVFCASLKNMQTGLKGFLKRFHSPLFHTVNLLWFQISLMDDFPLLKTGG